jgi:outer membrane protein assembly factor BamB
VTAVSSDEGDVEWTLDAGGGRAIRPTPRVVDDRVLVVSGGHREHRAVHGLDPATGEERWSFAPRERLLTVLGESEGSVFVATAAEPVETTGETLYALVLADGTVRWTVEIGDATDGLVTDGTVYVPSRGTVEAVGVDGERKWRYEGADYQSGTLAVAGDTVAFVTAAERRAPTVRGLDTATGEERWIFDDWRAFTTRALDGRLLVGGERLVRLDPVGGGAAWTVDREVGRLVTGGGESRWIDDWRTGLATVPVDEGTLYAGGESVSAVDIADGTAAWTADLDAAFAAPAGLANGRLVVHTSASVDDRDRHVHALDADSGERRWTFAGHDRLTGPAVGSRRAYLAGARTGLLALGL